MINIFCLKKQKIDSSSGQIFMNHEVNHEVNHDKRNQHLIDSRIADSYSLFNKSQLIIIHMIHNKLYNSIHESQSDSNYESLCDLIHELSDSKNESLHESITDSQSGSIHSIYESKTDSMNDSELPTKYDSHDKNLPLNHAQILNYGGVDYEFLASNIIPICCYSCCHNIPDLANHTWTSVVDI